MFVRIISSIPYVGNSISRILLGGEFIGPLTFSRVGALHIAFEKRPNEKKAASKKAAGPKKPGARIPWKGACKKTKKP